MSDVTTRRGNMMKRERLDRDIAQMEERVLNAATVEAARTFHLRLDQLRRAREEAVR